MICRDELSVELGLIIPNIHPQTVVCYIFYSPVFYSEWLSFKIAFKTLTPFDTQ